MISLIPNTLNQNAARTRKKSMETLQINAGNRNSKSKRRHSVASTLKRGLTRTFEKLEKKQKSGKKFGVDWAATRSLQRMARNKISIEHEADEQYQRLKRDGRIVFTLESGDKGEIKSWIIAPDIWWRIYWDVIMSLLVFYYAVVTPINMCFPTSPLDLIILEIVFNSFFVLDIILQFFSTYIIQKGPNQGRYETDHKKVIISYLTGWFFVDVLASFPFDILMFEFTGQTSGFNLKILRLTRALKLMRLARVSRIYKRLELRIRINISVARILKLVIFLFFVWHWIACSYWFICVIENSFIDITSMEDHLDEPWNYAWSPPKYIETDASFIEQYNIAYFWAVVSTTGIGKDIAPITQLQHIFTSFVIIIGVLIYASIIGSFGTALQSIDSPHAQKKRRIDAVREYLRQRRCTETLTKQILSYYDYCHERHITSYDESILHDIHSSLREQLDLEINKTLLLTLDKFATLPDAILLSLIHSLESKIYLPSEIVYLVGERADAMYFVARGDLKELNYEGAIKAYYSDGANFGEDFIRLDARRKTTISSLGHSELLVLSKYCTNEISKIYPEFGLLIFKWSCKIEWNELKKWERISYAIDIKKIMKQNKVKVTFEETYRQLNGAVELNNSRQSNMKRARMSILTPENHVSYEQFNQVYAKYYTSMFSMNCDIIKEKQKNIIVSSYNGSSSNSPHSNKGSQLQTPRNSNCKTPKQKEFIKMTKIQES